MTADRSPDELREPVLAEGGYVLVFSRLVTEDVEPGLGSPYRERFRTVATPEEFDRLKSGALVDVPDTIALVELITPDGLCIDSWLVLMTDEQNRAEVVDAIRYAIGNDPGPVPPAEP